MIKVYRYIQKVKVEDIVHMPGEVVEDLSATAIKKEIASGHIAIIKDKDHQIVKDIEKELAAEKVKKAKAETEVENGDG